MDEGTGLTPEAVKELRRSTDLALRGTKHAARAVGRSIAGSVAAERHLWLNLTEIREKEKMFLLDAPISQSGLFGEAVSSVVEKFRSAKSQSAALKQFMPKRMRDHSTPSSSLSREHSLPRKELSGRSCAPAHPPPSPWPTVSSPTATQAGWPEAARQSCRFGSSEPFLTLRSGWGELFHRWETRPDRQSVSVRLQHTLLTQICHTHPSGFGVQTESTSITLLRSGCWGTHRAFPLYRPSLCRQRTTW